MGSVSLDAPFLKNPPPKGGLSNFEAPGSFRYGQEFQSFGAVGSLCLPGLRFSQLFFQQGFYFRDHCSEYGFSDGWRF